jgi:MFS family permease
MMSPYVRKVTLNFTLAGTIVPIIIITIIYLHFWSESEFVLHPYSALRVVIAGAFLSGVIGGASLRMGWRAAIVFGLGLIIPAFIFCLLLVFTFFAAAEPENPPGSPLSFFGAIVMLFMFTAFYALVLGFPFYFAGYWGGTTIGRDFAPRVSAEAFGVGGAIGGIVMLLSLIIVKPLVSPELVQEIIASVIMLCFLIPYVGGGLLLARAIEKHAVRQESVSASVDGDA